MPHEYSMDIPKMKILRLFVAFSLLAESVATDEPCPYGRYGLTCDQKCEQCKTCEKVTGVCTSCTVGRYGSNCQKRCHYNCLDKQCDFKIGRCSTCTDGYFGEQCNKKCRHSGRCRYCTTGYYGKQCNQKCPDICRGPRCERYSGRCRYCADRYYGEQCNQKCPDMCLGPWCERDTGKCFRCFPGHYGHYCNNCSDTCLMTNNIFSPCSSENGTCILGCIAGFHGNKCELNCSENCNRSCEQQSGECTSCPFVRYGKFCEYMCSSACESHDQDSVCDRNTGYCLHGCLTGFYGDVCDNKCSDDCKDRQCNGRTGQCLLGYIEGYTGTFCVADSDSTTPVVIGVTNRAADSTTPVAIGFTLGAAVIIAIGVLVAVILYRKRLTNTVQDDDSSPTPIIYDDLRADLRAADTTYSRVSYDCSQQEPVCEVCVNTTVHESGTRLYENLIL